ncbi:DUF6929 family protein [Faecalibacter bovis]|uniref:Uncharacterized protein n=1 Tax=Faecalibacter bovis TaxID=2898187 RepID=A0ABX7XC54_9FLAO|nr:hypothetical protein [Faecalibacter bovis]QTV05372.1 hypothetical protein J9309_11430 [Faecalibacter bovis]
MLQSLFLKLFILINGLGASSGIVYHKNQLYVVSDDLPYLFQYDILDNSQNKSNFNTLLPIEEMTKKNKLDFESLAIVHNQILALGSGSNANRNELHSYNLETKIFSRYDISDNYNELRTKFDFDVKDFNIEGFAYKKRKSYLFNRGNGKNKINGIFIFEGLPHDTKLNKSEFIPIQLPIINNELTTFSDAIIVNNKIIFTATIEAESSTQRDGQVKESIIGIINMKTFQVEKYHIIAEKQKIEGITLKKKSSKGYTFLVCEDNDDDSVTSKIYELNVSKNFQDIY